VFLLSLDCSYENSVTYAVSIVDFLDDFTNETGAGRLADVITSRVLGSVFSKKVSAGRAGMRNMNPILVQLLREKGFRDAFQGATEALMQIPDENDPVGMLNFFNKVRSMGGIPYSMTDKRVNESKANSVPKADVRSIAEKYGY
jgi:hypothetical protein